MMTVVISPSFAQDKGLHPQKEGCVLNQPDLKTSDQSVQSSNVALITDKKGKVFFTIEEVSGDSELALAKHLSSINAVMYDAFWCPHCHHQKRLFGVEALDYLKFIECAPKGKASQADLCKQKFDTVKATLGKTLGFPTWEINGKFYAGSQSLEDLAKHSAYKGPTDFQHPFTIEVESSPLKILEPPSPPFIPLVQKTNLHSTGTMP